MITRKAAENQANRCFMYHVGTFAGLMTAMAYLDRRDLPWVAGICGLGIAVHGTMLYACSDSREMLVRTTASMMEDLQSIHEEPQRELVGAR